MPSIPLHPPSSSPFSSAKSRTTNPLPTLLHTPAGLALVELQSTIHTPPFPPSSDPSSQSQSQAALAATEIGYLHFPLYDPSKEAQDTAWMKRVYFYVGKHQRLTGEVRKLGKAVAIVSRRERARAAAAAAAAAADGGSEQAEQAAGEGGEELEVREIIRYKIVFSSRPEPVSEDMVAD